MDGDVIRVEDTEWPWPQFPVGARRNYDRGPRERLEGWEGDFLDAYRKTGYEREAARHARVSLSLIAKRQKQDPIFAAAFEEARREATKILEQLAIRRATMGVEKKKQVFIRQRRKDGTSEMVLEREEVTLEYSDQLLWKLLQANDPQKYGQTVDHRHTFTILQEEAERIAAQRNLDKDKLLEAARELMEESNK